MLCLSFAEMKRRMHAERKLPDARSYRAARFIESRLHNEGANKPTFEDMRREWNQETQVRSSLITEPFGKSITGYL